MLAASCETADPALELRDARSTHPKRRRGERLHGGSSRRKRRTASGSGFYLFDGIDHPLRIKVPATSTVAYYELDLAGNVRRLRDSGGSDLGGYRYTAFGQTKEDTATLVQPLRWKARWHSTLNGAEVYDVRARQWAPEVGAFLSVDDYVYFDKRSTLWGWPRMNPITFMDPTGHEPDPCMQCPRGVSCPRCTGSAAFCRDMCDDDGKEVYRKCVREGLEQRHCEVRRNQFIDEGTSSV